MLQDPVKKWLIDRGFWVNGESTKNSFFLGTSVSASPTNVTIKNDSGRSGSAINRNASRHVVVKPLTHVFLDGGKAAIPDRARVTFHRVYADAVTAGHPQHVVERTVGGVFRMFVDLDIRGDCYDKGGKTADLRDVIATVLECMPLKQEEKGGAATISRVREQENDRVRGCEVDASDHPGHGGENTVTAVVAVRCANGCYSSGKEQKSGAHIVWDGAGAVVSKDEAKTMRETCVRRCAERKPHVKDWDAIVDAAVYNNNGLRMLFSRKVGSRSDYRPAFEWSSRRHDREGGIETAFLRAVPPEEWSRDLPGWLQRFSIHVPAPSSDGPACVLPRLAARADDPSLQSLREEEGQPKQKVRRCEWPADAPMSFLSGVERETSDTYGVGVRETIREGLTPPSDSCLDDRYQRHVHALLDTLPTPYKTALRFAAMRPTPSGALLLPLNSRYCFNLRGEHRSNRVYLLIGETGDVFQGCTCSCDTQRDRAFGRCRDVLVKLSSHRSVTTKKTPFLAEKERSASSQF